MDQWNSGWWSRKFLNSKVVAKNVFVSLRAFEWYQNCKIWPIKILWNIIQSWLHHFMRRIIKFIFSRNSRFEFLFIQDKRAIVRLLLCLLFASIVSVEWPVVGRPEWCHIVGEKKVSTLSPNPLRRVWIENLGCVWSKSPGLGCGEVLMFATMIRVSKNWDS